MAFKCVLSLELNDTLENFNPPDLNGACRSRGFKLLRNVFCLLMLTMSFWTILHGWKHLNII